MQALMIAARALHFASTVSLAGSLCFLVLVAAPSFAGGAAPEVRDFGRRLIRLAEASLIVVLVSGVAWLILEASNMSGQPLAEVVTQDVVSIVLTRTQFGRVWEMRGILALLVAALLLIEDHVGRGRAAQLVRCAATLLSAAMLASLAWAGHAGATRGAEGLLQVAADALHLLAAGAWLGGLGPLALLLSRGADSAWLGAARDATRRFSPLGIASFATLLATGIVNTWFLSGSLPALLGTEYGRLLLIKIALFGAMVAIAAINRRRLTPQLLASAAPARALHHLRRNVLIETLIGLAILAIVGALGTEPPGAHVQPEWPLPFRLHLDVFARGAALDREAALHAAMVALGIAALVLAATWRRGRWLAAVLGLVLVIAFGRAPISWMLEDAYPTSFYHSPIPYDAPSIMRGAARYADQCSQCHGAEGRGDGPAAAGLPVKPADLTAAHLFAHSEGDLFWWISHGRSNGAMPGFADILSEDERWDVINFIRARAAAAQPDTLLPLVTPAPAPPAPDFAFEQGGHEETLGRASAAGAVLLVLYRLPGSQDRLAELDAAKERLQRAGLRIIAVPLDPTPAHAAEGTARLPGFAAATGPDTAAAYALFEGRGAGGACEFLIDSAGLLRARWLADTAVGLAPPQELLAQLDRLAHAPLTREPHHVHEH